MPALVNSLRDLHLLHQRAKALRDRLTSGPKTLAARQAALAERQKKLDGSRKSLQDARVQLKKKEHTVQGLNSKIDDLTAKLNAVKKNEEYKAIQNQMALDRNAIEKVEGEMLEEMERIDGRAAEVAAEEAEVKQFAGDTQAMQTQYDDQSAGQRQQLGELETAIVDAESVIPEDMRDRYRRTIKQHGAEALAPVDYDRKSQVAACSGCYVSVTTQALAELINAQTLSFCKTCGRVLYLPEEDIRATARES